MTLDEIKEYLRIDGGADDDMLKNLQAAVEEYLANAGISKAYNKFTYKLASQMLIAHWYTNRGAIQEVRSIEELPYGIRSLIQQLQYTEVVL